MNTVVLIRKIIKDKIFQIIYHITVNVKYILFKEN